MVGQHLKAEKCEFQKLELKYLLLIIGNDGVKMDSDSVAAVKNLELPKCTFDIQLFVAISNFY